MKDLYLTYFEMWDTLGGSLFVQFSSLCSPGVYGAWCVLENVDQDPAAAPKYQALLELIAAHPAPDKGSVRQTPSRQSVHGSQTILFSVQQNTGEYIRIRAIRNGTFRCELFDLNGKRLRQKYFNRSGLVTFSRTRMTKGILLIRVTDLKSGSESHILLRNS